MQENSPLWLTIDRTPLQYHTVEHIFRLIKKHTGIHIHPHKLRHTFASMMAASGADAFVLKELLGHESVATTEIYVKLNEKTLANAQQTGSPLATVNSETIVGAKRRGRPRK
jgi:site-specific recombinase XerD